ncbi:MAG: extracellular solute-binding protein [Devosia sp.]|jgi:putative spermidine/putrescine transport system substrate-binding protein|uniref:extracellular solute-binding protein n=1 Tax=unclassified Devosia TaxID=196773 RepID=UPI001A00A2ED|nr:MULTISPECIES: extracellular solute-binding protein [unclassified Devosia]MBF0678244.1 extracellular solute-binding protein [Devosia sp.]WEJ31499.1 extracellular solute-binding protein [Devosia sp. SD17-2]
MKRIACYAAVTAVSLFPCLPAFAQDYSGRTLVVGTWGGDIERLLKEHVAGPLEAKTGAKVEFLLGGSGDRLSKMVAERNNPTMDVTFQNIYEAPNALKEGLVVAPDAALVPAAADVWAGMNDGCYAMSLVGLGIAYSKAVFPEAPEWADLWNPELKGKMAYAPYPSSEGDGMLAVAARIAGVDESNPDAAFAKLAELGAPMLTYNSLDEVLTLMDAGEIAAAPMISGYVISNLENYEGIGFVFPKDPGPVLVRDMVCQVANSPEPELAQMFIDLALGVDTQTAYAQQVNFGPTNSKVVLSDEEAARVINTPEEVDSLLQLDWEYVITQRSDWTDRWNKQILGQ